MAIKFDELLEALDPSLDKIEEDVSDFMYIIIPTERRYDDLTPYDYDKFIRKYGIFDTRDECIDKIIELAPDRWDAFIPMRIEGVNESLNESNETYTKEDLEARKSFVKILNSKGYKGIANIVSKLGVRLTKDPSITLALDKNNGVLYVNSQGLSQEKVVENIVKYFNELVKNKKFVKESLNEYGELQGSDTIAYDKGWEHYESDDMPADGVWLVKSFETDRGDLDAEIQADSDGVYAAVYKSNGSQVFSKDDFDNIGQAVLTVERVVNDRYNHYYEF